jgi:hypothetical protein
LPHVRHNILHPQHSFDGDAKLFFHLLHRRPGTLLSALLPVDELGDADQFSLGRCLDNLDSLADGFAGSEDVVDDDDFTLEGCANEGSAFSVLYVSHRVSDSMTLPASSGNRGACDAQS